MSYLWLKYFHILAVIGWISSTSSLGLYLLYQTIFKKDLQFQDSPRRFYRFLTIFEILFFLLVISFGIGMYILAGYGLDTKWIRYKIFIAFLIFLPLEAVNVYMVWKMKDKSFYEKYDRFVLYISPVLIVAGLTVIFMAVFKIN